MDATSIEAQIKLILTITAVVLFFRWVRNKRNKKFCKHCPICGRLCHPHPTNLVIKGTGFPLLLPTKARTVELSFQYR